jgi:hypothetical protein
VPLLRTLLPLFPPVLVPCVLCSQKPLGASTIPFLGRQALPEITRCREENGLNGGEYDLAQERNSSVDASCGSLAWVGGARCVRPSTKIAFTVNEFYGYPFQAKERHAAVSGDTTLMPWRVSSAEVTPCPGINRLLKLPS